MNYILVAIATLLLAFDFALQKKYQSLEGTDAAAGITFNIWIGLFTAVIFFALSGFLLEFSLYSLILAFFMSLFNALYIIVGFRILKTNSMALYSVFLMSGGMLLPYIFGVAFLDEPLTILRVGGIVLILVAVTLFNKVKYDGSLSLLLLCTMVFLFNGTVSIISKTHQISTAFPTVSSTTFVMYVGIWKFIFGCITLPFVKKGAKLTPALPKHVVWIVVASALIGGVSYMLQLVGAKELPATVLYPLVTGGSILFSAFAGKVFFKEKLSAYQWISIALCFLGTLLFL